MLKNWLNQNERMILESVCQKLAAIRAHSAATHEQIVKPLQYWCQRAKASDTRPLAEFSRRRHQHP